MVRSSVVCEHDVVECTRFFVPPVAHKSLVLVFHYCAVKVWAIMAAMALSRVL